MTYSVKISELPVRATCYSDDIVPVVDGAETTTSTVTAGQIAALGGGAPGTGTVTTDKLANDAVTAAKCSFTGPDKLFSKTTAGAGPGVEIDCTAVGRALLSQPTTLAMRDYIGIGPFADAVFAGQTRFPPGSAAAPSIISTDDLFTGLYFGGADALSYAANAVEVFRFNADGTMMTRSPTEDNPPLRVRTGAVAWCNFNGSGTAALLFSQNQSGILARYGLVAPSGLVGAILGYGKTGTNPDTSVAWTTHAADTRQRLKDIEAARNYTLTFTDEDTGNTPDASWFDDSKGKINSLLATPGNQWPEFCKGTERRANFTFPNSGTRFFYWHNSQWKNAPSSGLGWIGTMILTPAANLRTIRASQNIATVTRVAAGTYDIVFETPMQDSRYCVAATAQNTASADSHTVQLASVTNNGFQIITRPRSSATATDTETVMFAVWR